MSGDCCQRQLLLRLIGTWSSWIFLLHLEGTVVRRSRLAAERGLWIIAALETLLMSGVQGVASSVLGIEVRNT